MDGYVTLKWSATLAHLHLLARNTGIYTSIAQLSLLLWSISRKNALAVHVTCAAAHSTSPIPLPPPPPPPLRSGRSGQCRQCQATGRARASCALCDKGIVLTIQNAPLGRCVLNCPPATIPRGLQYSLNEAEFVLISQLSWLSDKFADLCRISQAMKRYYLEPVDPVARPIAIFADTQITSVRPPFYLLVPRFLSNPTPEGSGERVKMKRSCTLHLCIQ